MSKLALPLVHSSPFRPIPEGATLQSFEIDEYTVGSIVTYPSGEDFEEFIGEQTEARIERRFKLEKEMTMVNGGHINIEVGNK